MLDRENVVKIAKLAKLQLDTQEVEIFSQQLPKILEFIEKLEELETENILPFYELIDKETPLREDIPQKGLSQEEALSNAPEKFNGFFVVPRVVDKE
ncbi:MAG: Asp-tRNA(Asn)/Glu-tRNA(Gln) amidotransferase subunit GatC [Aquificae bacterium]|nr:Asp-tRNA(Asn)/Glu-tRNA(Gln) amidotransferase subunit GatC [Aquificota bacterium]